MKLPFMNFRLTGMARLESVRVLTPGWASATSGDLTEIERDAERE